MEETRLDLIRRKAIAAEERIAPAERELGEAVAQAERERSARMAALTAEALGLMRLRLAPFYAPPGASSALEDAVATTVLVSRARGLASVFVSGQDCESVQQWAGNYLAMLDAVDRFEADLAALRGKA
jgi:hypothetical protein